MKFKDLGSVILILVLGYKFFRPSFSYGMQPASVANVSSSLDSKTWRSGLVVQQDKDSIEFSSLLDKNSVRFE